MLAVVDIEIMTPRRPSTHGFMNAMLKPEPPARIDGHSAMLQCEVGNCIDRSTLPDEPSTVVYYRSGEELVGSD